MVVQPARLAKVVTALPTFGIRGCTTRSSGQGWGCLPTPLHNLPDIGGAPNLPPMCTLPTCVQYCYTAAVRAEKQSRDRCPPVPLLSLCLSLSINPPAAKNKSSVPLLKYTLVASLSALSHLLVTEKPNTRSAQQRSKNQPQTGAPRGFLPHHKAAGSRPGTCVDVQEKIVPVLV